MFTFIFASFEKQYYVTLDENNEDMARFYAASYAQPLELISIFDAAQNKYLFEKPRPTFYTTRGGLGGFLQ